MLFVSRKHFQINCFITRFTVYRSRLSLAPGGSWENLAGNSEEQGNGARRTFFFWLNLIIRWNDSRSLLISSIICCQHERNVMKLCHNFEPIQRANKKAPLISSRVFNDFQKRFFPIKYYTGDIFSFIKNKKKKKIFHVWNYYLLM